MSLVKSYIERNAYSAIDYTGVNPKYRCEDIFVLTNENNEEHQFHIPRYAPFFSSSVRITRVDVVDGIEEEIELEPHRDYYFGGNFWGNENLTIDGKLVATTIIFDDISIEGTYKVVYQTLGGDYLLDSTGYARQIAQYILNPLKTTWDELVGKKLEFTPDPHVHHANELTNVQVITNAMDRLTDAYSKLVQIETENHGLLDAFASEAKAIVEKQIEFERHISEMVSNMRSRFDEVMGTAIDLTPYALKDETTRAIDSAIATSASRLENLLGTKASEINNTISDIRKELARKSELTTATLDERYIRRIETTLDNSTFDKVVATAGGVAYLGQNKLLFDVKEAGNALYHHPYVTFKRESGMSADQESKMYSSGRSRHYLGMVNSTNPSDMTAGFTPTTLPFHFQLTHPTGVPDLFLYSYAENNKGSLQQVDFSLRQWVGFTDQRISTSQQAIVTHGARITNLENNAVVVQHNKTDYTNGRVVKLFDDGIHINKITLGGSHTISVGQVNNASHAMFSGYVSFRGFSILSDQRLKTDIVKEPEFDLSGINLYSYVYKDDPKANDIIGLIAQEVEKVDERLVVKNNNNGVLSIKYDSIIAILLDKVNKLEKRIEELERGD